MMGAKPPITEMEHSAGKGVDRASIGSIRETPPGPGMLLEVPRDARPEIGIAGDPGDARPNARLEACQQ